MTRLRGCLADLSQQPHRVAEARNFNDGTVPKQQVIYDEDSFFGNISASSYGFGIATEADATKAGSPLNIAQKAAA
jgi:hypothetical protein